MCVSMYSEIKNKKMQNKKRYLHKLLTKNATYCHLLILNIYTHTHTYAHTRTHTHNVYTDTHTYSSTRTHTQSHIHVHTQSHTHTNAFRCTCTCMHTRILTNIHNNKNVHSLNPITHVSNVSM